MHSKAGTDAWYLSTSDLQIMCLQGLLANKQDEVSKIKSRPGGSESVMHGSIGSA